MLACAAALGLAAPAAGAEPAMLTRDGWGARAPVAAMEPNAPVRITIHHTATRARPNKDLAAKMKSLQSFSQRAEKLSDGRMKPAWPDVPYHFYVGADGRVAEGREPQFVGDTNTEYDPRGHVGIAVEGNFEVEEPSAAQIAALTDLIVTLARRYKLTSQAVGAHDDFAKTQCPGAKLKAKLPEIRKAVDERLAAAPPQ